jgi:hypothetical protein
VRDYLQRRAGPLVVASWLVAFFVWWMAAGFVDLLDFWIYCYPFNGDADAWRLLRAAVPVAKAINLALPIVATAFFPQHRFQAGRAAGLAILVSALIWLGCAAWVATHYYPS